MKKHKSLLIISWSRYLKIWSVRYGELKVLRFWYSNHSIWSFFGNRTWCAHRYSRWNSPCCSSWFSQVFLARHNAENLPRAKEATYYQADILQCCRSWPVTSARKDFSSICRLSNRQRFSGYKSGCTIHAVWPAAATVLWCLVSTVQAYPSGLATCNHKHRNPYCKRLTSEVWYCLKLSIEVCSGTYWLFFKLRS